MFLHTDPQAQLAIYHQRSDELARQAAEHRRACLARGGHRRSGWWQRKDRVAGSVRAPVAS